MTVKQYLPLFLLLDLPDDFTVSGPSGVLGVVCGIVDLQQVIPFFLQVN